MTRQQNKLILSRAERLKEYDEIVKLVLENLSLAAKLNTTEANRKKAVEQALQKIKKIYTLRDEQLKNWGQDDFLNIR